MPSRTEIACRRQPFRTANVNIGDEVHAWPILSGRARKIDVNGKKSAVIGRTLIDANISFASDQASSACREGYEV
jgi:hypothetical protein